jgi:hypothetical protein
MPDTVQEVRWSMPEDLTVKRIQNPDEIEFTDSWVRITKDDRIVRVNSAVPVIIETRGADDE